MKVEDAEKLARKISTGSQPSVIAFPGGKEEKKQEEKKQEKV